MTAITIKATAQTPEINGNSAMGILSIKGRSYPSKGASFFRPLRQWLANLYQTKNKEITIVLELEYINTTTVSVLVQMFKRLNEISKTKSVRVVWKHEVDDLHMQAIGAEFRTMTNGFISLESVGRIAS